MAYSFGRLDQSFPDFWKWRGHRIAWTVHRPPGPLDGEGSAAIPVAVLIHGFGASIGHWRHVIPVLGRHVEVYALDLLGFGASDKPPSRLQGEPEAPGSVRYCFDLWGQMVSDFVREQVIPQERPVHLIGNSIGGLVALVAALELKSLGTPPAQVVLIDCAQRTLDEKRVGELPIWEQAGRPFLKRMVQERWLLFPLFRLVARPAFIRRVLNLAYPSGANVDDALVALLLRPAMEAGALESFRGFVNLFEDRLAQDVLAHLGLPVRMIWGALDPWEAPSEARRWADRFSCVKDLRVLEGLGHCPHDEAPERVNPILLEWIGAQ